MILGQLLLEDAENFEFSKSPVMYDDGFDTVTPHKHIDSSLRTLIRNDADPKKTYGEQRQETQMFWK